MLRFVRGDGVRHQWQSFISEFVNCIGIYTHFEIPVLLNRTHGTKTTSDRTKWV